MVVREIRSTAMGLRTSGATETQCSNACILQSRYRHALCVHTYCLDPSAHPLLLHFTRTPTMTTRRIFTGSLLCTSMALSTALTLAPSLATAQSKLKVAAIYTVPFEQQWVSRIHKALKAAARKVAKDFPKTSLLLGSSGKPQAPNFSVFDNYIQEPAYLSGMVAGGMTKTNKIGMVGGFPIPAANRLMHAFMAGAKETNPKVEFTITFINSWFDPPKAKEATFAMIDKGADVLYAERFGVSDAAKEKGKLAIGNVIDTQPQYPDTVVASAIWHMEPSIDRALKLVKEGKFTAEDYGPYSMMKHKGSELAPLGTFEKKVPADIVAKVKAKEADILAGKFTVKVDDSQPKSTAK